MARPPNVPPDYVDYETAAAKLGLTAGTFRDRYGRAFPTIKAGGRGWVPISAIEAEIIRRASGVRRGRPPKSKVEEQQKSFVILPDVKTYSGRWAARAVQLFTEGKTVLEVVVAMALPFEVVEHFWAKYQTLSRAILLDTKTTQRIKALLPEWKDNTGAGLADAFTKFIARVNSSAAGARVEIEISPEEAARLEQEAREDDDANRPMAAAKESESP